jgi:hypothetical protein
MSMRTDNNNNNDDSVAVINCITQPLMCVCVWVSLQWQAVLPVPVMRDPNSPTPPPPRSGTKSNHYYLGTVSLYAYVHTGIEGYIYLREH